MAPSQNKWYLELQIRKHKLSYLQCLYSINFITLVVLVLSLPLYSQVGIGTKQPHISAELEVKSSDRGFLLPRLTTAERHAIVTPAAGLQVYDTVSNSIWYFNATIWVELGENSERSPKVSKFNIKDQFFYLTPKENVKQPETGLIRFDGNCFMLYDGNQWVQLDVSSHSP